MRTTRRYFSCCTRRSTSTTIVFSILALVTRPVRIWCSWRVSSDFAAAGALLVVSIAIFLYAFFAAGLRRSRQFLRAQKRFYPREILFCFTKPLQRFGLSGGQLKTQPENLFSQLFLLRAQL